MIRSEPPLDETGSDPEPPPDPPVEQAGDPGGDAGPDQQRWDRYQPL